MYNVLRDIQEIDLQVLQNFTEYSQAVSNNDQQARNLLAVSIIILIILHRHLIKEIFIL